jgi:general secretion pathway protein K
VKISGQSGSALIITVLLVTVLVALVVEFAYEVYIDTSSLSNWENAQKASLIAKSGQTLSTKYLTEAARLKYTDIGELIFPVERDLGSGTALIIKIEDENTKLNINAVIRPNGTTDEKALSSLKKLFEYLNINTDLALVIADWIDPDIEPRLSGSEDSAKNAFLWSVDELRLIPGVDKDIFDKIRPFVTVFGNSLININTAKLPVLVSLHKDMTETLAERIIDYRNSSPFELTGQVTNVSGMESIGTLLQGGITVKSSYFRVTSAATVNEIKRIIESVVDTSNNIYFWREG